MNRVHQFLRSNPIALALLLALVLAALPVAALAAKSGQPFTADGFVFLTDLGHVQIHPQGLTGKVRQLTVGERIQGFVVVSAEPGTWPELEDATLTVDVSHNSNVLYDLTLTPGLWTIVDGKAHEQVDLYLLGQKVFEGRSKASISGWFDQSVFQPVTCSDTDNEGFVLKGEIVDDGAISLRGVGDFKGQSAEGDWTAHLVAQCIGFPFAVLSGEVILSGMHFAKN
ncbi:MAG: hypothetical protein HY532_00295 [Chloroflexi bacterium]|nr:hypothetical protein [Chloroflexota bacterium]